MSIQLTPHLGFKDNAREAMEFYQSVFGGKLTFNTYKEFHASDDPSEDDKIMHGQLEADNGLVLMAADTPNRMPFEPGTNFSLALSGDDEATLRGYFEKLAAGGHIDMPLDKAAWGATFGMLTDKFGIRWMVNIAA